MTSWLNPAAWNGISVVTLAVLVCVALMWAIVTEKLVTGRQYRATLARAIAAEGARDTLTRALIEKNASDEANANILAAIRGDTVKGLG